MSPRDFQSVIATVKQKYTPGELKQHQDHWLQSEETEAHILSLGDRTGNGTAHAFAVCRTKYSEEYFAQPRKWKTKVVILALGMLLKAVVSFTKRPFLENAFKKNAAQVGFYFLTEIAGVAAVYLTVLIEQRASLRCAFWAQLLAVVALVGEIGSATYSVGSPLGPLVDRPHIASIIFDRLAGATKIVWPSWTVVKKIKEVTEPGRRFIGTAHLLLKGPSHNQLSQLLPEAEQSSLKRLMVEIKLASFEVGIAEIEEQFGINEDDEDTENIEDSFHMTTYTLNRSASQASLQSWNREFPILRESRGHGRVRSLHGRAAIEWEGSETHQQGHGSSPTGPHAAAADAPAYPTVEPNTPAVPPAPLGSLPGEFRSVLSGHRRAISLDDFMSRAGLEELGVGLLPANTQWQLQPLQPLPAQQPPALTQEQLQPPPPSPVQQLSAGDNLSTAESSDELPRSRSSSPFVEYPKTGPGPKPAPDTGGEAASSKDAEGSKTQESSEHADPSAENVSV